MSSRRQNAVGEEGESYVREHTILEIPALQPLEEVFCRICLDEPREGEEALQLACSCRGELAVVHKDCAVKWFSLKGNNVCDVCHQVAQNIPLELLRIQNQNNGRTTTADDQARVNEFDAIFPVYQEWLALMIVSMPAYFCIVQKFLVVDMDESSIGVSTFFAFMIGFFSAMTSTTMARGRYAWLYAVFQFICVAISAYTLSLSVNLDSVPILTILFATFVGFGVAFCCAKFVVGSLMLRAWMNNISNQNQEGDPAALEMEPVPSALVDSNTTTNAN